MLVERIITGITFGLIILLGIFYLSPVGFDLLSLVIATLAAWEFLGLFNKWDYQKRVGFLVLFVLTLMITQFLPALPILLIGVLWWLTAPYFMWRYTVNGYNYFANMFWQGLLATVIFIPCWTGLVIINGRFGKGFLLYLLVIVCVTDIGAYFTGKLWGKHLLAPAISPKKTVEGLMGGILTALLVAIAGVFLLKSAIVKPSVMGFDFSPLKNVSLIMLSLVTCLWSVIGDLFESMLKRLAGVKDSGRILPGHGGMYDRIDSLTSAIPIFALGLLLI